MNDHSMDFVVDILSKVDNSKEKEKRKSAEGKVNGVAFDDVE